MTQVADKTFFSQQTDFPYFRRIWKNVVVALLATSFIPLIVIGGGMYHYTATVLEEKTLEALRTEVTNHKNTIDQFLELTLRCRGCRFSLGRGVMMNVRQPAHAGETFGCVCPITGPQPARVSSETSFRS